MAAITAEINWAAQVNIDAVQAIAATVLGVTLGNSGIPEPVDPVWTPISIANLDGWWRPSPTTTGLVAGQKVTTLADLSSGTRPFVQTTYESKPRLVVDGSNYALQFDGVDDFMSIAGFPSRAVFEAWVVYRWDLAVTGTSGENGGLWGRDATTGSRVALVAQSHRALFSTHNTLVGPDVLDYRTRAASVLVAYRTLFVSNGTNVTLSLTTPTLGSVDSGTTTASSLSEGNGDLSLGVGNPALPFNFAGNILEFGRTNGQMSSGDRTLLNTYLTTKYPGVI